jgi:hypothetical protein
MFDPGLALLALSCSCDHLIRIRLDSEEDEIGSNADLCAVGHRVEPMGRIPS